MKKIVPIQWLDDQMKRNIIRALYYRQPEEQEAWKHRASAFTGLRKLYRSDDVYE